MVNSVFVLFSTQITSAERVWVETLLRFQRTGENTSDVIAQESRAKARHTQTKEGEAMTRNSMMAFPVISRRVI
ncbi:hypothetical protein J6590_087987 [Homalodisca vitripennis]|nr:hypothetical protein J6590_087987 [Homalodisca vitripennis]